MRKSRFTDEQIVAIVRGGERRTGDGGVPAPRREQGDAAGRWRAKYRGMELQEAKRLKALEEENRRLKRLVAELALDNSLLKDVVGRKW